MLTEKMVDALNSQINEEFYSAYLYMAMAEYYQDNKLPGFASWLRIQADEELGHGMKIISYLQDRNARAIFKAIAEPPREWKSPQAAVEEVLKHERHITSSINKLSDLAFEMKDHATRTFLDWYVKEQVEEEGNITTIIDQISMVAQMPSGLFMIDRELAKRAKH
ncbi:MAG: ferritin [Candidatus Riflebacteria bacterium]|nr:ferritin [Candidatus Riflebacteria bacterium]